MPRTRSLACCDRALRPLPCCALSAAPAASPTLLLQRVEVRRDLASRSASSTPSRPPSPASSTRSSPSASGRGSCRRLPGACAPRRADPFDERLAAELCRAAARSRRPCCACRPSAARAAELLARAAGRGLSRPATWLAMSRCCSREIVGLLLRGPSRSGRRAASGSAAAAAALPGVAAAPAAPARRRPVAVGRRLAHRVRAIPAAAAPRRPDPDAAGPAARASRCSCSSCRAACSTSSASARCADAVALPPCWPRGATLLLGLLQLPARQLLQLLGELVDLLLPRSAAARAAASRTDSPCGRAAAGTDRPAPAPSGRRRHRRRRRRPAALADFEVVELLGFLQVLQRALLGRQRFLRSSALFSGSSAAFISSAAFGSSSAIFCRFSLAAAAQRAGASASIEVVDLLAQLATATGRRTPCLP